VTGDSVGGPKPVASAITVEALCCGDLGAQVAVRMVDAGS
jgi:hypothetical protein